MVDTPYDPIIASLAKRQRSTRNRLFLFNAMLGYGTAHLCFCLLVLAFSQHFHELLDQAAAGTAGSTPLLQETAAIFVQPGLLWGGLVVSLAGAGFGLLVGWFQSRILQEAGEVVRGAHLEQQVAQRTVDLTTHNQRMTSLNQRLEETSRDLEEKNRALREAQEKLVRSERLAAITETAVSVNHEINNPLMVILGQSQLLQRGGGSMPAEEVAKRLGMVEKQALRISEITNKLACLAEPVTTSYLEEEGIRMVDVSRSRAGEMPRAGDLSREPEEERVTAG